MLVAEVPKYFRCLNSPTYSRIFDQLFEENIVEVPLYCEQATDWSKNAKVSWPDINLCCRDPC